MLASAAALALGASIVADAAGVLAPRPALLSGGGKTVRAELGSYCVAEQAEPGETATSVCADAIPPREAPRPRLAVEPRQRLTVKFRHARGVADRVERVAIDLMRFDAEGFELPGRTIKASERSAKRWRFRLPRNLRGAQALSIFTRLESGDATHYAGIRSSPARR